MGTTPELRSRSAMHGQDDRGHSVTLGQASGTSSTLDAVLAEVSMKMSPCSLAKASPSSRFTSRRDSRSLRGQTGVQFNDVK